MQTPKIISLTQIMFHTVNTLLALVPFSARHLQYGILYLLITFAFVTPPRFSRSTTIPSASVSTDRKPWRIQMSWHLVRGWATTQYGKGSCHSEPSHIPHQSSELTVVKLAGGVNDSMRCNRSVQNARFYLPWWPAFPACVRKCSPLPCRVIWSQASL